MKKLLLGTCIASALGLAGCGAEQDIQEVRAESPAQKPFARVLFDPGAGNLNVPNDLLMLPGDDGFFDFTLNIPVADPTNFGDPQNALNVLDGWSVQHPFTIDVVTPEGLGLDAGSLANGVRIFEATLGLNQTDPVCAAIPVPSAGCKVGDELVFGVDFVASLLDENTISVVPLRPFKAAQGHLLVITERLRDSDGRPVKGSSTWELARQDIQTNPLSSQSQLDLQGIVNSHIDSLAQAGLTDRNQLSYVAAFTTQSTQNVLATVKQLMVAEFAARSAAGDPTAGTALPAIVATDATGPQNALEILGAVSAETVDGAVQQGVAGLPAEAAALIPAIEATDFSALQTCDGLLGTASGALAGVYGPVNDFAVGVATGILGQAGPLCAATAMQGTISLPYYSGTPSATNPLAPVNTFWQAACDSGIVLAGAPAEALAAATPGPNAALCTQVGLADLRVGGQPLDFKRNLTQYSPVPQANGANGGNEVLDVQITVPNELVAAALGFPITKPADGWPVVMLAHGITSQKEDMLSISGALALAGFATVAIDQPLHGSRGFDLNGDGVDDLNATTVTATHYMNLASLPTARDNLRQSVSDLLGLRLGLNAFVDASASQLGDLDTSNVSIFGVSLGAITGGNFAALANTPFSGDLAPLSGLFAVQAAGLESPGGGVAQFLVESPTFGPLIKGLLLAQASEDFQGVLTANFGTADITQIPEPALVATTVGFLDALSAEQLAGVNAVFAEFAFAAQTVLDAGDPNAYATTLGANTPVLMQTVVGDGGENLPDQVIPVSTSLPLSGQLPYAAIVGLEQVSATAVGTDPLSGLILFNQGAHGSSLNPAPNAAVTAEMQSQIANYVGSGATAIVISNTDVVN